MTSVRIEAVYVVKPLSQIVGDVVDKSIREVIVEHSKFVDFIEKLAEQEIYEKKVTETFFDSDTYYITNTIIVKSPITSQYVDHTCNIKLIFSPVIKDNPDLYVDKSDNCNVREKLDLQNTHEIFQHINGFKYLNKFTKSTITIMNNDG